MRQGRLITTIAWATVTAATIGGGAWAEEAQPQEDVAFGLGRRYAVTSQAMEEVRHVVIRVPSGYESTTQEYGTFYLLGSGFRERLALVASTLEYMAGQGQIPPLILVGVELPEGNFGLIPRGENDGGTERSDRYARFLEHDVFPFVERTVRSNGYRVLYGASNSGVGALYWLFSGKVTVQATIASSPMLGWSPDLVFETTRAALRVSAHDKRSLFLVASDDDFDEVTDHFDRYVTLLESAAPTWLRWKAETRVNEGHVPEVDAALGLRMIFEGTNPAEDLGDAAAIRRHYDEAGRQCGMTIAPPPALLFDTGMHLVSAGEPQKGREVFDLHVALYPKNARGHAGLGLALKALGETEAARGPLHRALELDPEQRFARRLLDELDR